MDSTIDNNFSIVILTLNEEVHLEECIDSLSGCDDIVVFDSNSSDSTEKIAITAGVRFVQHQFDDYSSQRNAALETLDFKYPWVFFVDADERMTPELIHETRGMIAESNPHCSLYHIRCKNMLMNKYLRHSGEWQGWLPRLVRRGGGQFINPLNEAFKTDGQAGILREQLVHYPFRKGLGFHIERCNKYSSVESEIIWQELKHGKRPSIFASDQQQRNMAWDNLARRLPVRILWRFIRLYLLKLGVMDGLPGLMACTFDTIHQYMIDLKLLELKRHDNGLSI